MKSTFTMILILSALLIACGGGGGGSPSPDDNNTPGSNDVKPLDYSPKNPITDNPTVIKAVRDNNFQLYSGENPPLIEGDLAGNYTSSDDGDPATITSHEIDMLLSNQSGGRVACTATQPGSDNLTSSDAYISGEGKNFSLITEVDYFYGDCQVNWAILYSGLAENSDRHGTIISFTSLSVPLSKSNCDGYSIPTFSEGAGGLSPKKPDENTTP